MAQQEISEVIAERDRLRAALVRLSVATGVFLDSTPWTDSSERREVTRADNETREILANTSPAPVESVNKELLDVLRNVERGLTATGAQGEPLRSIRAAIAKAEKAGA